jgi:hypothetical protein
MTRVADIAWTLLKFIGRAFALSGAPTPFHLFGLPLPPGPWHPARTVNGGDRRPLPALTEVYDRGHLRRTSPRSAR